MKKIIKVIAITLILIISILCFSCTITIEYTPVDSKDSNSSEDNIKKEINFTYVVNESCEIKKSKGEIYTICLINQTTIN